MIEINNLNVLYNNSIRALDNVSIKIEQQKCIAIVGENGSGKSTLLSSLLGLVETQGEIKINGVMLLKERYARLEQKDYDFPEKEKKLCDEVVTRIISIFEEKSMSYEEAYNMLNLVHEALLYRSTKVKL